jgi:soluble lytic murein transglycosylase-like protein
MVRQTLVALVGLIFLSAVLPLHAMPTEQYLQLRRKLHYDPAMTYSTANANPAIYIGKVFEIRGRVFGTISRGDHVSFMMSVDQNPALLLNAPVDDQHLIISVKDSTFRVLVQVVNQVVGNTVPLKVVGIARDDEVSAREKAAVAAEALAKKRVISGTRASRSAAVQLRPGEISELARKYLDTAVQAVYPAYSRFIYGCNHHLTAQELDSITVSILYFSQRYRVDPRLVIAMIIAESDFDPRSTSNKGAMGLGQLMPEEAQALKLANPYDPINNIKGSIDLLRGKLDIFRDPHIASKGEFTWRQISLALAAYNAGAGAVRRYGGIPPYKETQNYVRKIIRLYRSLCGYSAG